MTTEPLCFPKMIFWDFDGVIKDSLEVKTKAFVELFQPFGDEIADRVRQHHEDNGGMSRFDKMPLYLKWAGETVTQYNVDDYCHRFSNLVFQGIVDAPWVPGAEAFLRNNKYQQEFVLVTATPQVEIEEILVALDLCSCFTDVYGSPMSKKEAISTTLAHCRIVPGSCLMIGDSTVDYAAAQANRVPFLLRRHATNGQLFQQYSGDSVEDFTSL
jgi:phosphoglycolate phosphatase-like HAD superfamily hydrolase